ncbi:MAG TPA: RNA polymerase sigma factor [Xanthomonadales bacterium]|nr:RNA polymerase sigma factor [Xanthomonadales bacterium]
MSEGERQWIAAASRGDQHAFRRLVELHARSLYPVCVRILGDPALAEDAVQEALINAHRALDRFDGRSSFATWLHRIAVNAALGIRRARHAEREAPVADDETSPLATLADHAPEPAELASGAQLGSSLANALDELTTLERTAFVLRHLEQYPLEDIATALESNVNACKQAIFRAVRKLRTALAPWRVEA